MSVITWGELLYGAAKSRKKALAHRNLDALIAVIPSLPLPLDAAQRYGEIRASLERKGMPIDGNDLWIAAHALATGSTLITNNEREFKRVPGLVIENWAKNPPD